MQRAGSTGRWQKMQSSSHASATLLFFLLLLILIWPGSASVSIYNATAGGTVQDLINSSVSGDSVFLPCGFYYESLVIDRPIIFGALDTENPPVFVPGGTGAALTLDVDGITVMGIEMRGPSATGLVVRSNNNRVSSCTIDGFSSGISLQSASSNIFSGNAIVNNSVGIISDRQSRTNTFYLNHFDNENDISGSSFEHTWSSGGLEYEYENRTITGPLGNSWGGYDGTDSNGDGIGDTVYQLLVVTEGQAAVPSGMVAADRVPLVAPLSSYTLLRSANETPLNDGTRQGNAPFSPEETRPGTLPFSPEGAPSPNPQGYNPTGMQQPQQQQPSSGIPSGGPESFGAPPSDTVTGFLLRYWGVIPILIVIAVAGGILFERYRRRHALSGTPAPVTTTPPSRNATIITTPGESDRIVQEPGYFTVNLPPILEKKYPDAEYLGEGGVGRVFRAHDQIENRTVAIKIPVRFDEVTGAQFTRELQLWQGLHHENIVEVYAANVFPMPYIELEYVDLSLAAMKFPLSVPDAVRIVRGIGHGLRYAHERGIVHRDIKPENILLTREGTPKITDWGLAKALADAKHTGVISFSLSYAAPEQLAPNLYGEAGPWTDIYQLGVLFYELVSGRLPFTGSGMGEVTHAILHTTAVPPDLTGKGAGPVIAIIEKCMKKKPQDRYGSIEVLLADLDFLDRKGA